MTLRIALILGSTRPGRRGDQIAAWALQAARAHGGADYELVDLADHDLGNLDEPGNPNFQQYQHSHTRAWGALIDSFDGYVFIVPEYNHSYPGALKNALDYVYKEWNYKPAAFVSYGGVSGGLRAVQMEKMTLTTLKMAPIVEAVTIPMVGQHMKEGRFAAREVHVTAATAMLTELARWAEALRPLRQPRA